MSNSVNRSGNRQSISGAISVSLGLNRPTNRTSETEWTHDPAQDPSTTPTSPLEFVSPPFYNTGNYLGRSYVSGFLSVSPNMPQHGDAVILPVARNRAKSIHESQVLHKQTAELSNEFGEDLNGIEEVRSPEVVEEEDSALHDWATHQDYQTLPMGEELQRAIPLGQRGSHGPVSGAANALARFARNVLHYFPSAVLGLLLNILDGLSYGMIIFPITEPIFSHLGSTGLSMFYISTIVSQVLFSCGLSSFTSGIGSEMIEVTPFFHTMAFAIKDALPGQDDDIITTTLFCYVISSLVTGITFYALGKLKLGKIVGFFPRHILIGCIGGVGYFLLVTGLGVTTRVAKVEYTWQFFKELFTRSDILWKWLLPVLLTVLLINTQNCFQNSLVLPSFYIITLILFHFIVAIVPSISLGKLRDLGWIFPAATSNDRWFDHYKLFDLRKVHWGLVLAQIPTMLALTFFGILHVPINVPALAISLQMDKYDVDKELIAHGYSNFVSGLLGSIQNYLVYTNSVLFIRAGADSPFAGYLLAVLTFAVMVIGPVIVSFIPICIVGSLIFLLGYELLEEALVDTWGKVTKFEYVTIVIIVFTMGIYDFVLGVIVGILIACFSFLVDSTKLQTINGEFDGKVAKSTVNRDYVQSNFLNGIGEQIYVLKLQNVLFFGTIISIEEKIDKLLEISDSKNSTKRRIKYLILDFKNINADNIDYSAAEGFNRIKRFTQTKRIKLIISSIRERDHIYNAFSKVGLLNDVELFSDLNGALEWCENEFLSKYKKLRDRAREKMQHSTNVTSAVAAASGKAAAGGDGLKKDSGINPRSLLSLPLNTPRNHQMLSVAQNILNNEEEGVDSFNAQGNDEQPVLQLLLFALKSYRKNITSSEPHVREKETELWSQLAPYFIQRKLATQSILLRNDDIFFVVETGLLKIAIDLPQGIVYETMSNRTCYGSIVGRDNKLAKDRKVTIVTETDSSLWVIDSTNLQRLRAENLELYTELVLLCLLIKSSRFEELLGYTLVSA
ncbi:related to sulfate transporter family protein [Zygosaccharomyces bailii ISA1307]|nr:related to sulfate transporter family protein [Zygosaccharomyces bailii ISA1307]